MNKVIKGLGIVSIVLGLFACTAKENPEEGSSYSGGSSIDIFLSPASLELVPGESSVVSYSFNRILSNPQVVVLPATGLQVSTTPAAGGQTGTIQVTLSADIVIGTVLQATVVAVDGDLSVQKPLNVTAKEPEQAKPLGSVRNIRTIKLTDDKQDFFVQYEYNNEGRVLYAHLYDGDYEYLAAYEYPSQSSVIIDVETATLTCFITEEKLVSFTEQNDGGSYKTIFEYDAYGHLASVGDESYIWTGGNITSSRYESDNFQYSSEISYTSYPDKGGLSFTLWKEGMGDEESGVLVPILSRLSGINSENLPASVKYTSTYSNNTRYYDYAFDNDGYVKTVLTDDGMVIKIWYVDEPESDEEKPEEPTVDPVDPGSIMDVTGAQFLEAEPSSTQLYRLKGAISSIGNSTYGNVTLCTEDGSYIWIYGISSSPIGYGGATDRTFANHRLRVGDEVTLVGYAYEYNDSIEMNYGYLESSYRLQASDFAGTYSVFSDMIEYEDTFVEWTGVTVEVPTNGYMLFQGMSYYKDDDWVDTFAVALGEYDDETGTVKLLNGWFNRNYYWWYNSDPDQKYISIFYTVKADNSAQSYTWANSDLVLRPSGYLRSSTWFGLDRADSAEESQYIFLDHYYDSDSGEVGEGTYRSDIFQFYFMLKRSESVNSPALHRSLNKESVRKAQIPQSGKKVPMGFSR